MKSDPSFTRPHLTHQPWCILLFFVFFYWLISFIIIKNFSIVSANWFQKLFKEKLRLIEMRQKNQDNFTIHIRMVYSHPKLITDLNLTISLLVSQVWSIDQTFFEKPYHSTYWLHKPNGFFATLCCRPASSQKTKKELITEKKPNAELRN